MLSNSRSPARLGGLRAVSVNDCTPERMAVRSSGASAYSWPCLPADAAEQPSGYGIPAACDGELWKERDDRTAPGRCVLRHAVTVEATTLRERAANVIDVHRLAGELGVSAEVILRASAELDGWVSARSTLTDELASQVRTHLRTTQRGFAGSAGSPIFSVGTQQPAASGPQNRTIPPAFPGREHEDNPGQQGQSRDPGSGTSSDDDRSRRANATVHEEDALASQLAAQAAASALAAEWRAAGLGRHDRHIIEQCQRHGLTPQDVRVRVDGQTIASRLKNGESISSVRSRIG
jgi:hypothetical protein